MSLRDEVSEWTASHFSVTRPIDEVPELLRSIATSLDELGSPLEVLDLMGTSTYSDDGNPEFTVTVYLSLDDDSDGS